MDFLSKTAAIAIERARAQTAQRLAQEALRESELRSRNLLSGLPVACYTLDDSGRISFFNDAAVQLWGREPKAAEDFWCGSHRMRTLDGKQMSLAECPAAIAFREQRSVRGVEAFIIRPDGTERQVVPHPDPLYDAQGKFCGIINVIVDVTQQRAAEGTLRESEAFLQSVVGASADCIKVLTLEGKLQWMSEGGRKVMEVCDFSAIENAYWPEFWPQETREDALSALRAAREGRVGRLRGFCPTCAGTPKWWDVVVSPINGDNGKPRLLLCVSRDVSGLQAVEEALKVSREELRQHAQSLELRVVERTVKLQETISELESFSYSISHDMRAPLRAMQSFARILEAECKEQVNVKGREFIRRIIASADRMDRLIQDVLGFSRLSRSEIQPERVELHSLLAGILESYPQFDSAIADVKIVGRIMGQFHCRSGFTPRCVAG